MKTNSIYKMNGSFFKTVEDFPDCQLNPAAIGTIEGFLCNMLVNPDDGKICLSYKRTDLIEFYDSNGTLIKRMHGPDHFLPVIVEDKRGNGVGIHSIEGQTRDTYFGPVAVDNMILHLWMSVFRAMKKFYPGLDQIVVFVIICLITIGCEPANSILNKNSRYFSKFPEEETVVFKDVCEYKEGIAGTLILIDSTLVILNEQPGIKNFLNCYSLKNGILSNGYLSEGRGPGEAIGPMMIGASGDILWVQDVVLNKVFIIDKNKVINQITPVSFIEYPIADRYYMIGFKDSLHYFGVGSANSEYKIQEIDLITGKVINEYGKIEKTPGDISLQLFKSAYQSFIFTKPTGDKIVLPYRFLDAIEIYNIKTKSSVAIHGPEGYDVAYSPMGNQMTKTEKTRIAFVHGTVTNEYIYLSYSGRKRYSSDYYYGSSIYVYDWDGNPVRKLILNRYIQGLVVSEDNKTLYAFDVKTGFLIQAKIN